MYLYEAEIPLAVAITSKYCAGLDVRMIILHVFIACFSVGQLFINKNRDQAKIRRVDVRDKAMGNLPLENCFRI